MNVDVHACCMNYDDYQPRSLASNCNDLAIGSDIQILVSNLHLFLSKLTTNLQIIFSFFSCPDLTNQFFSFSINLHFKKPKKT
jgi:hypothetical protein